MNSPNHNLEEDDDGEVFIDESDVIHEVNVDEEDLPDVDDEEGAGAEVFDDEDDDSMHAFTGHTGELYTVACSPTDPTLVATGGGDDKGFLWKIGNGDWSFELAGQKESVTCLSFSSDGQLLASGCLDGHTQIWDIGSNGILKDIWFWLVSRIIQCGCGMLIRLPFLTCHGGSVTCGDFTPDGKTICTGSKDATLRIWNPKTGEAIHVVQGYPYHMEGLICLTISFDSALAFTAAEDGSVHIVNTTTGKVVSSLIAHTNSVETIALSKSSHWAASGDADGKLIIWDLHHSTPRFTCEHGDQVMCLIWLGSSRYIAAGCGDGRVQVWDSLSGECIKVFKGHSDSIQSLSVSANGDFLVSASLDGTARVFEISEFR
ncbi:LOW QUALITY PROTEIN: WD40 repeat [Dillenia turbinata]|uniref:WD40 repeat n=1 Tax=Dillenia turbinata TaxID=194707 RepID=A0AAN8ZEU2_9MAGN